MATKLQIANRALLEVNGSPILSLDERTGTARIVKAALEGSIEEVQALANWPILRRTIVLQPSVEWTPVDAEFTNAFKQPADFGNVVHVTDNNGNLGYDYRLENGYILSNLDSVYLRYNINLETVTEFPPYLVMVLVAHLAYRIVGPITGDLNGKNALNQEFKSQLRKGKILAARESPPQNYMTDTESRFIEAHDGYGEV